MNVVTRGVRNAFRNGIRTFSIIVILSLSIALALAMVLARGAVQNKIDSVKSSIGNTVTITPAGVQGIQGGGEPLKSSAIDELKNIAHVASVTKGLRDQIDSENTSLKSAIDAGKLGLRFRGPAGDTQAPTHIADGNGEQETFTPPLNVTASTDLTSSEAASDGKVNLTSGKLFATDSTDNVAIIGKSLAEKNSLSVGSTFTAYGTTIQVVGIYDTGNTFTNGSLVMPLATLQKLSGQDGELSNATVKVDNISNVESAVTAIKNKLGTSTADVTSQQGEAEAALAPLENIKTISLFSLIGAIIAGAVIILLTMVMIVRERRREIGVLKAIGASNVKVMFQFMSEAVTFTVIAAAVGVLLGIIGGNPITEVLVNNSTSSSASQAGAPGGGAEPMLSTKTPDGKVTHGGPRGLANHLGLGGENLKNVKAVVGWDILLYGLGAALLIAVAGSATAALLIAKIRPAEVMRVE